jgi:hypothetical protein
VLHREKKSEGEDDRREEKRLRDFPQSRLCSHQINGRQAV